VICSPIMLQNTAIGSSCDGGGKGVYEWYRLTSNFAVVGVEDRGRSLDFCYQLMIANIYEYTCVE
jgi:hypothetical protein